jgi:hypothetical protein
MTPTLSPARPGSDPVVRAVPVSRIVVSTHKVRDRSTPTAHEWLPYGTQHAWEPGTRRTLCGEYVNGWTVFWERPFTARPATACPACIELTLPEASRRRLDPIERPAP